MSRIVLEISELSRRIGSVQSGLVLTQAKLYE